MIRPWIFNSFIFLTLVACNTFPHSKGRTQYIKNIEQASAGDKQFSGLYDHYEFRATLLSPKVLKLRHERMNQIYEWDPYQKQEHWQEQQDELFPITRVWMSFFTPDSKNDNLDKKNSIWKTYLVVDGRRYEGEVKRSKQPLSEAKALFQYHTRWGTIYHIDFSVAADQVEDRPVKLIITGPLGRREVFFNTSQISNSRI